MSTPSETDLLDTGATVPVQPPRRQWAMLAYIAGDNDLSDEGLEDIREMCEVGASDQVWAAVEIDTIGDWEGSIRYEISRPQWDGSSYRMVIERLSEQDSGGMTVPQLARVLRRTRSQLPCVSILGFDACTMATVEITHELSDLAEFFVGSQALVPGEGWRYDQVLYEMDPNDVGPPAPEALAKIIVDRFVSNYQPDPDDATQSAIRLSKVPAVHAALYQLGGALTHQISARRVDILLARDRAQTFDGFFGHVDLIDLCRHLEHLGDPISVPTHEVIAKAREAIVHSGSVGQTVGRANGLSVCFPRAPGDYFSNRREYLQLRGCEPDSGWVRWLDALHG